MIKMTKYANFAEFANSAQINLPGGNKSVEQPNVFQQVFAEGSGETAGRADIRRMLEHKIKASKEAGSASVKDLLYSEDAEDYIPIRHCLNSPAYRDGMAVSGYVGRGRVFCRREHAEKVMKELKKQDRRRMRRILSSVEGFDPSVFSDLDTCSHEDVMAFLRFYCRPQDDIREAYMKNPNDFLLDV